MVNGSPEEPLVRTVRSDAVSCPLASKAAPPSARIVALSVVGIRSRSTTPRM